MDPVEENEGLDPGYTQPSLERGLSWLESSGCQGSSSSSEVQSEGTNSSNSAVKATSSVQQQGDPVTDACTKETLAAEGAPNPLALVVGKAERVNLQQQQQHRDGLREIRSMIIAALPFPPMPIMVCRELAGECRWVAVKCAGSGTCMLAPMVGFITHRKKCAIPDDTGW
jgi:hypothetical protein